MSKKHISFLPLILLVALMVVNQPVDAQRMYRWVDEFGQTHFSQTPPQDQQRQSYEQSELRHNRRADIECCQSVRELSQDIARALYTGTSVLNIHRQFPATSYPNVVEITNFVAERTRMQMPIGSITSSVFDACMNLSLLACRHTESDVAGRRGSGGSGTAGTAFAIAEGWFLTNQHVVDNCRMINIGEQQQRAEYFAGDERIDLALLRTTLNPTFRPALRVTTVVELGEPVLVAGYPLGHILGSLNITTGTVSAQSGPSDQGQLFQITAPVQPGSSGGPVLDEFGQLIGVVVSRMSDIATLRDSGSLPQNINFAIQLHVVKAFLDRHNVSYLTSSSPEVVSNRRIARYARDYTVPVQCLK